MCDFIYMKFKNRPKKLVVDGRLVRGVGDEEKRAPQEPRSVGRF